MKRATDIIILKVRNILNALEITDDDTRQDIYLKAISEPWYCKDKISILMNIINPVLSANFKQLKLTNKFIPMTSLCKTDIDTIKRNISTHNDDTDKVNEICDASKVLGMLHSYIINEYFIKQTDRSEIVSSLQITDEMFDLLLDKIVVDIRSVLNK